MRVRASSLVVCLLFVVWAVGIATAQSNQSVQITKGPAVENAGSNSAVIAWSTNTNASTILKYGTDPNNLSQTAEAPWGGLTHRVTIHNLNPNTTYYFQVTSAQAQGTGTGTISTVEQFKTTNGPGASNNQPQQQGGSDNAQVVVGPIPQQVTANSAQIYWETTQPTENIVKYGTSQSSLNQTAQSPYGGQTHHVSLNNLQPSTTYYFSIEKPDGTVRSSGQFQTEAQNTAQNSKAVQITNGPNVDYLANNAAKISWSTNVPASSVVKYGTDPNSLSQTAQAPWGPSHTVTLSNLNPNTKYYFQIQSAQGQGTGTTASSNAYSFQTIQNGQSAMTMQH